MQHQGEAESVSVAFVENGEEKGDHWFKQSYPHAMSNHMWTARYFGSPYLTFWPPTFVVVNTKLRGEGSPIWNDVKALDIYILSRAAYVIFRVSILFPKYNLS